jgi:hypothetical protein
VRSRGCDPDAPRERVARRECGHFDGPPQALTVAGATLAGTVVEALQPEFFDSKVDAGLGNVALAVIFKLSPPFDTMVLPPSPEAFSPLAVVWGDLSADVRPGSFPLELRDSLGTFPVRNIFTSMGTTIEPVLENGTLQVSLRPYRRGYVNGDGRIDISDSIFVLEYLFGAGEQPTCFAAADANGDSRVDLGDAVWLLGYIFAGRARPPDPFFACGDDPQGAPRLSCESQSACP